MTSATSYILVAAILATALLVSAEPGTVLWKKEIPGGLPQNVNNMVFGEYLVVKTGNGDFEVTNAWTGKLVGKLEVANVFNLALNDVKANKDYFCILNMNNQVSCLKFADGSVTIKNKRVSDSDQMLSLSFDAEARVAVIGQGSYVVLRLSDGQEEFKASGFDSLVAGSNAIYTLAKKGENSRLEKIEMWTGKSAWAKEISAKTSLPRLRCASSDVVVLTEGAMRVVALDTNNKGAEKFAYEDDAPGFNLGTCSDGYLVFGNEHGQVIVIDLAKPEKKLKITALVEDITIDIPSRSIINNYVRAGGSGGSPFVTVLSMEDGKELWKRYTPVSGNAQTVIPVGDDLVVPNLIGCNFFNIHSGGEPAADSLRAKFRFGFPGGANIVAGQDPTSKKLVLFNFASNAAGQAELTALVA